ncbi:MAG: EVE domain-containing protein [Melioribacteraceae bacterium]
MIKYWLIKSEPDVFSIDDLANADNKTTYWDGVRNYQARNFMRDEMKIGDKILYYHSNSDPMGVAGICEIVKEAYPDFSAFDKKDPHFDPKSKKDDPTWFMIDVKFLEKFKYLVTLSEIKNNPKLSEMKLIQRGSRLSVMPITKAEFEEIAKMAKAK